MNWTPWIKHTGTGRPEGLKDERRMQAVFINRYGYMGVDGTDTGVGVPSRTVRVHHWDANTLAYRLEIKTETHVVYGKIGDAFTRIRVPTDTHKITYTVEDGEVVSCVMEKL